MVNYLYKRWELLEHPLVHFENLHKNRLKIVLELVNYKINTTNAKRNMHVYHLDYKQQNCNLECFLKIEGNGEENGEIVLLIDHPKRSEDLSNLEEFYTAKNVTVIFQTLPRFFDLHSISKLTYRFPFSNNYLPKILEHHPSKTIEYCSLYRSFDYQFYYSSLSTPLLELCTRTLPTSIASKCVKRHITD
jgi:hypothetical protein